MTFPNVFCLDERDTLGLATYLRRAGWLDHPDELLDARRAGQGNMNYVLRVRTRARSFILKQSRPWVEKYPRIAAPWDRALVEAKFYQTVQPFDAVAACMPRLLGFDAEARILQLSDLGESETLERLYWGETFGPGELTALKMYLSRLHAAFRDPDLRVPFANAEMRALNHEHIFRVPFDGLKGLNLDSITPGLAALAGQLQGDAAVQRRAEWLGQLYLGEGECLVHGDYFPGSWMRTTDGIGIIDPEFCFFGRAEFDWGVMLAHLHLARLPAESLVPPGLDLTLVKAFAGVEILRRLIGVAQLPLRYGLEEKRLLLCLGRDLLLANG